MKTKLLKCTSVFVTCLLLLFSFQGNSISNSPQCPDGYYYTDCVPAAIGLSDPCYPGCAPKPGMILDIEGEYDFLYTVSMGCILGYSNNYCRVECKNKHLYSSDRIGQATRVYTSCPKCGSSNFKILIDPLPDK